MLQQFAEQEEMLYCFDVLRIKEAIDHHGIHAIMDALLTDNKYKVVLENYLTSMSKTSKLAFIE